MIVEKPLIMILGIVILMLTIILLQVLRAESNCSMEYTAVAFAIKRLLNKPYENEVNLREQKIRLKCCQPLDFWYNSLKGLDL